MPNRKSQPTIKDVAQRAGVSAKTVSKVLGGASGVSEATREQVITAQRELDFVPNLSARSLRSGRAGVIGLALPGLAAAFSASLMRHVVLQAQQRGFIVQVEDTGAQPERERDLVSRARSHHIDGMILNPVRLEGSVVQQPAHLPPVVLVGEVEQHLTDRVYIDSTKAARLITEHLIHQGTQRIVVLGGGPRHRGRYATQNLRLQGYEKALSAAGLQPPAHTPVDAEWTISGGARAIEQLLKQRVRFDAVMCLNDSIALGALQALHRNGIEVPEQVLVSGFDDVEHAGFTYPPLTTIQFDHAAYAETALDLLITRIQDRSLEPRAVEIPFTLIRRQSTQVSHLQRVI